MKPEDATPAGMPPVHRPVGRLAPKRAGFLAGHPRDGAGPATQEAAAAPRPRDEAKRPGDDLVKDRPLVNPGAGRFGLDEYTQHLIDFLAAMGPGANVVAVCQPCVAALAAILLAWLVLYHFADAIQVFCVFALRCYGVTLLPLVTYTLLLWGVGLAGGYEVAYAWPESLGAVSWLTPQSPLAFWQTSSLALCFTAALLLAVLWRVAYRQRHHTPHA